MTLASRWLLLCQLALASCAEPRTTNDQLAVSYVDSLIKEDSSAESDPYVKSLTDSQKVLIFAALENPAQVVDAFLSGLQEAPDDNVPAPINADSVFGYFIADSSVADEQRAFFWGEVASARRGDLNLSDSAVYDCQANFCLLSARVLDAEGRKGTPAFVAIERPRLAAFLSEPLLEPGSSTPVDERRGVKGAKRDVARVVCRQGRPVIEYAPKIEPLLSPIAFAFVRAHEYAHVLLRHVRCDGERPGEGPIPRVFQRELDADCKATSIIFARVPFGGISVISQAAGEFYQLNWPAVDYPGTRERSDSLYRQECEQR